MDRLTLDALIDSLTSWREVLPGDTPIAHSLTDEGDDAELLGSVDVGFLIPGDFQESWGPPGGMIVSDDDIDGKPDALRVVVLWPALMATDALSPAAPNGGPRKADGGAQ